LISVRTAERLGRVPNKPKTQHRSVRIEDADWDDAEQATAEMGTDRAKVINQFIRWYLHRPGAKLPQRPNPPSK
jgi:recombinational DNA repair protein (RecF pathway)